MLTPQEISNKEFAKAVFGGYDMAPVDSFIDDIAKDYADLYKENAVLKNKLKVLVEKIEEYRATEDAMRMALLTAQKMAKEITDEAEKKSRTLVEDAERAAREKIEQYRAEVAKEQVKAENARKETAAFVGRVKELFANQAVTLERLENFVGAAKPVAEVETVKDEQETELEKEKQADEIEKSVAQIIEKAINTDESEQEQSVDSDTKVFEPAGTVGGKKTKFEFYDLQFGDEVDVTK